jgi:sec-independent protein translocase protein TatB
MFDISFSELLLCFVVALVVLGPERMPGVARAVGRWTGKARGYMRNLTAELERETHIVEMKQQVQDAHRILREQSDEVRSNVDLNLKAIRDETNSVVSTVEAPSNVNAAPTVPPASPPTTPAPAPTVAVSEHTPPASPQNHYGP